MNIHITKIVNDKIASLEAEGTIKNKIEESIEKTVLGAITSALEDWSLKRDIEKQVSESVSDIAKEIGFSAYNGFIAEKIKQITEGVMREDVAQKIQKVFDDMLIVKHDGIKLSEIFNKYREWVCEHTDESDKWERREFVCALEEKEEGGFHHYKVRFNSERLDRYDAAEIEFSFCTYGEKEKAEISRLKLDGDDSGEAFKLGYLTEVQSLLANLYFNKTEIILDIGGIDDDNRFDIDD